MNNERKKIAIVGSGIAGLSAAWLLGRHHNVTLFEKHERPGMGAFNLNYQDGNIEERIDVPLRAFNTCYYKNLVALYAEMGVEIQRTDHSASYSTHDNQHTYFGYQYFNLGKRAFPWLRNMKHFNFKTLSIAKDAARFLVFAKKDYKKGKLLKTIKESPSEYMTLDVDVSKSQDLFIISLSDDELDSDTNLLLLVDYKRHFQE